ncbi:MAG: 4-demethylwyosine synthase TYW1, partial [Candidatus Hadarchaeales archaeon]
MLEKSKVEALENAGYRIVGSHGHSAVKVCHWTKKSLLDRGACYKEKFYGKELGVRSHLCLQLTPSLPFCDHRCIYCWRNTEITFSGWMGEADDPAEILEGAISAQRLLLSGFGGNPDVNRRKFEEAQNPRHCAISLAGEPMIYPKISELVEECRKRRMTSFLVSNGLHPEVLERLRPPTQLYISLVAPDEETYREICRPVVSGGWEKLNRSLEVFSSLSCRRVLRLTLVKGVNLKSPQGYARLIEKAEPDFVEGKGYMWVGYSRRRLGFENMPTHQEIQKFCGELAALTGYKIVDECPES